VTTAAEIVSEAHAWEGTPFHWQASVKGVGADCKGLIAGIADCLEMPEGKSLYALKGDYGRVVDAALLKRGLAETLDHVVGGFWETLPGDIWLLKYGGKAQHLAVFAGSHVIHTYNGGPKRVISTRTEVALRAWPLDSVWRFRSLEG